MLKQRVITALILMAVLLPTLFAPVAWPFAVFTLIAMGAAGWEWARMNGATANVAKAMGVLLAAVCAVCLWGGWGLHAPPMIWWVALLLWVGGGAVAIKAGPTQWPRVSAVARQSIGFAALWLAWLAISNARAIGINFLLSIFALAWAADICAYFGGRQFGRRKLAPAISPGKSWEGVWSGMLGALVLAFAWIAIDQRFGVDSASVYSTLQLRLGTPLLILVVVFLDAMSVVGDLVESLAKRAAGMKDSSALLPGHGGVLDRIDALLPLFPLALAMTSI